MVKKVLFWVISAAILVCGYSGFNKLNYWERCVRIVKLNSDEPFDRRMGRGGFEAGSERRDARPDFRNLPDSIRQRSGSREGRSFERPEMRNLPDSVRRRFENSREGQAIRGRVIPDSLRREFRNIDGERTSFEAGIRSGGGRSGRGDSRGQKINLDNIWWFTAVFASFTVIMIYFDKLIVLSRNRNRTGTII